MNNKLNITKLEDATLENVSGGLSNTAGLCLIYSGGALAVVSPIAGAGCTIASAVYSSKARKALQRGDTKKADKYTKTAKNLSISSASLCPVATIAGIMAAGAGALSVYNNHQQKFSK